MENLPLKFLILLISYEKKIFYEFLTEKYFVHICNFNEFYQIFDIRQS